ncbi:hypothetical protein B0H10DRAFT_2130769 [Mycena sp. CBHHK59/15]|nr:hypothetical protein B0H10DRAFT_2130769 [Mycena sp. CBHHK59/15]
MAFFGLSILMFSACMFFCTALNLQLVLVHHFYYIGSVAVVAILNITPYAAGQFGYYNGTCWFSDPRPDVQFRWLLGSQSAWMLLMSTGEVVSFFVILGYMLLYRMRTARVWSDRSTSSFGAIPKPPIVEYRSIIIRIGLYPLLSCCLNFTGSIIDIWCPKTPSHRTDLCVFALRPILYTLLAASDPSFLRAIRALRNHGKSTHCTCPSSSAINYASSHSMKRFSTNSRAVVHVRLEQEKTSMPWRAGYKKPRADQSTGSSKPFEEQTAVSHGDAKAARGKPSFLEQEPEQSGLSEVERGGEREVEEELDVEAQTRSRAEDIAKQI